jgi:CRISPR-associated protein Cas5d
LKEKISESAKQWDKKTTSPGHAYQEIFNRRISRGQCFTIPCLGWKEFGPDFFGPFRKGTSIQMDYSTVITSMLREVFPKGYHSNVAFSFDQNVEIKNGIMIYPVKEAQDVE